MSTRVFPVLLFLLLGATLASAGCFSAGDAVGTASSASQRASHVESMLDNAPGSDVTPTGVVREFDLYLHRMPAHEVYPGATMPMWGFSLDPDPTTASVPGPTLRVTEGDTVIVNLRSTLAGFNHTLHFHGQHVPWDMDGVPWVSQEPVEPDETFTYIFTAKPAGTYWYHCHVDATHHVDMGMYGVFIVDPQDPADDPAYDGEFVMVLDDMDRYHLESGRPAGDNRPQDGSPESYEEWLRRQSSDAVNRNEAVNEQVTGSPVREERDWYPVTYAPYTANYNTFMINGQSFPWTQPLTVEEGNTYRIRFVNAGNSVFYMHLHGHHVLVTHKDGILLESPYWVDTLPIGPAERYDVYLRADNPGLWDFHDHNGLHTMNDNIFPGGAMTMLCYTSHSMENDHCMAGGDHQHGGAAGRATYAGDLLNWSGYELA